MRVPADVPDVAIVPIAGPSTAHGEPWSTESHHTASTSSQIPPGGVFRRPNNRGFGNQPIVEPASPPPRTPSDVASNRSTTSNGATFFRNYHEHGLPSPTARNGVITPDLVFAEIGHGRGTGHQPSFAASRGYSMGMAAIDGLTAGHSAQIPPPLASPTDAVYGATMSTNPLYRSQGHDQHARDEEPSNSRSAWAHVHREATSPVLPSTTSTRELHDSVQAALSGVNRPSADRGRNVTRGLRSATYFLFGRGVHTNEPHGEGNGGTNDR
jgi:F-box and leucine-rich repeat protein GRR1